MVPTMIVSVTLSILTLTPTPTWNFAVIGDTQANPRIFDRAIADIKKRRPDFAVHLGDMGYCGSYNFWNRHRRLMKASGVPWKVVLGNHELYQCDPNLSRYSKARWLRYWYNDGGAAYRSFTHKGIRFLLLDTANVWTPLAQNLFLRKYLSSSNTVFMFGHRPLPYPHNPKFTFAGGKRWVWYRYMGPSRHGWAGIQMWKLIYRYRSKIKAYFHGHHHSRIDYKLNGVNVHCTAGGGGNLETSKDIFHYLMVHVNGRRYSVKTIPLGN